MMKFTKLTSAALVGATTLSAFMVPAASFAATPNNNADANGGTALPQTDTTEAGISFGNPGPNPNTGYLRLQKVPSILDFGNHVQFNKAYPNFTADGKNTGNSSNDRFASYKEKDTNLTPTLSNDAKGLENVQGMTWTTVVDKQVSRTNADDKKGITAKAGLWSLYVKADGDLNRIDTAGNIMSDGDIADANLTFKNTTKAQTQEVYKLTGEAQDKDWKTDATAKPVSAVTENISVPLAADTKDNGALVAQAKDGEGSGADVFAWNPADINLSLPASATVQSPATYQAKLTWTLSADAATPSN